MSRPLRRLLCALGLHPWGPRLRQPEYELRGCTCCPATQYRLIDCTGHALGHWEPWDAREPVLGPERRHDPR